MDQLELFEVPEVTCQYCFCRVSADNLQIHYEWHAELDLLMTLIQSANPQVFGG